MVWGTYWIHFEVDEFSASQGNHNLSLIDCTSENGSLPWCLPFIDSSVCSDVTNSIRVNLKWINTKLVYSCYISHLKYL